MSSPREDELASLKDSAKGVLDETHQQAGELQHRLSASGSCRTACDQLDAQFRSRLRTYSPVKWAGKPHQLSPLMFASHGWTCISSDMVQCDSCGQYLGVELPSIVDVDVSVYHKAIKKIVSAITTSHHVTCTYRYTSAAAGNAIPFKTLSKETINQRYEDMKGLDLKEIKVDISEVPSTVIPKTDEEKCKALVCFGWQKSQYLDDAVICTFCNRTVGLWLLRGEVFDVEKQHQKWCIFGSSASRNTDLWQDRRLVLQHLKNPEDISITDWVAKAQVWKSAIMPRNEPDP